MISTNTAIRHSEKWLDPPGGSKKFAALEILNERLLGTGPWTRRDFSEVCLVSGFNHPFPNEIPDFLEKRVTYFGGMFFHVFGDFFPFFGFG